MRTLKLYGTGSATANAVANVIIPSRTTIRGIQCSVRINSITDGAQVDLEVSKASAREIAVNGAQQCVIQVCLEGNFVTSGLAQQGINQFFPQSIAMEQGQILYLHALIGGTVVYDATFVIHYD